MVVKALPIVSKPRNGLGSFVLPCKRITIQFAKSDGSSIGIRKFLETRLNSYAAKNSAIEFRIFEKSGHPTIKAEYAGGFDKTICLRKMSVQTIEEKFDLLKNSSGKKLKKTKDVVTSMNPSVRGIWSPLHVHPSQRFKI